MIRRDYFVRMVQELMAALQRVAFLRRKQETDAALQEIDRVLCKFWDLEPEQAPRQTLDDWVALCFAEEGPVTDKLVALADLFKEQGELFGLKQLTAESRQSYAISLGLYLETLQAGMVSKDLIDKTDHLIEVLHGQPLPGDIARRVLGYFEARGQFARAEDLLFEWLGTDDPVAREYGLAFYERLLARTDAELAYGGLPRPEVEAGRQELQQMKS